MRLFHAVALFLPLFVCAAPSATAPQHLLLQPALAPVVTATNDSCVEQGWTPPELNGGSMLDLVSNGMREPINVILSGHSDPYILTLAGLRDFVRSVGFSFECFGQHIGQLQRADTGDGRGWKPEVVEFRQAGRWDPGRWIGTCRESLFGGNHFRAWKQNGPVAPTDAWFLAVSLEKSIRYDHTVDWNGYNRGRDRLVEQALEGGTWGDRTWIADVEWVDGLLKPGRHGINHGIRIDGRVAVLTVRPID